jgi:hypothetical protein
MRSSLSCHAVAALAVASLALALPAAAGAATSKYPPDPAARGFDGGPSGWTPSSSAEGTCLSPLLCASVENTHQASGGADGGGYIRSAYTGVVGAMAVAGTTTAVWQSPRFSYGGAAGEAPTAVSFTLDRRANVDQLLSVSGSSAEYTVQLLDLSEAGETTTLVAPTTLAGAETWTEVSRGGLDPEALVAGHDYRIQITSRYTSGTSSLVDGSADYDNVVLSAVRRGAEEEGGDARGGDRSGALSTRRLEDLLREATPGTAVLRGNRLFVQVRCPRKVGRTCRTTAQGLLAKRRPATRKRTVRLRKGKSRLIALRVKPKARARLAKRKRLLVSQKVRAGRVTATVYKTRKLIRRD